MVLQQHAGIGAFQWRLMGGKNRTRRYGKPNDAEP